MSTNEDAGRHTPEMEGHPQVPPSWLTILMADDHWVSRTGMRHLLGGLDAEVEMVEAASFGEALTRLGEHPDLDLVVADLLMPDRDAFDGLSALVRASGDIPVVVMSMIEDRRCARRAIELGAAGYIAKTGDATETLEAIETVLSGDVYIPTDLGGDVGALPQPDSDAQSDIVRESLKRLTRRQRDVFLLLGSGRSTGQIAKALDITEFTVRGHTAGILRRLGLKSRTQAALLASQIVT